MKKFLKKIAAAAAAVAVVSTFAVGVANAAVQDYVGYMRFDSITLKDKGGNRTLDPVQKHDYYDYAVVYFEEGTVSSGVPVHMRVYTESGQQVTGEYKAEALERYPLYYTSGEGATGDYYKLSMNAGYYGVTVSGKWAP